MTALNPPTLPGDRTLPVVEVFGPTIQGEGPHAGRRCYFVRLGGCNLSCSWCDSAYTWDGSMYDLREEVTPTTPSGITDQLSELGWTRDDLVILTGGEPLMHQHNPALPALLGNLEEVHVETNGTLLPTPSIIEHVTHFSVSPKLGHAGTHKGRSPEPAKGWDAILEDGLAIVKVVIQTEADAETAADLADRMGATREQLWLMPEGITTEVLQHRWADVCNWAITLGCNATHRLHVLAYGDKRGV